MHVFTCALFTFTKRLPCLMENNNQHLDKFLKEIILNIHDIFFNINLTQVSIFLYNKQTKLYELHATTTIPCVDDYHGYKPGEGLVGWIAQKCEPLNIGNIKNPTELEKKGVNYGGHYWPKIKNDPCPYSYLGLPITNFCDKHEIQGVISLIASGINQFKTIDIILLKPFIEGLINILSINDNDIPKRKDKIIQQLYLNEIKQIRYCSSPNNLENKNCNLSFPDQKDKFDNNKNEEVSRLFRAISKEVLKFLVSFLNAHNGIVRVLNKDGILNTVTTINAPKSVEDLSFIAADGSGCGEVLKTNEIFISDNTHGDIRTEKFRIKYEAMSKDIKEYYDKIKSQAVVPMFLDKLLVGTISLHSDKLGFFSEKDRPTLSRFTDFSISTASSYEQVIKERDDKQEKENKIIEKKLINCTYDDKEYEFIGINASMKHIHHSIDTYAPMDTSLHLFGETGTGKEVLARVIHKHSKRKDKKLVILDLTTLSENTIESELFGHEAGSFTGALKTKKGFFEIADKSTLFLDEIANISEPIQKKLLRALEQGTFFKMGGTDPKHSDVRLITATNKDLNEEVREGRFREDLYYRIIPHRIVIPPLRDRLDDIAILSKYFIRQYKKKIDGSVIDISDEAIDTLKKYTWPGNVRQLKRVLIDCAYPLANLRGETVLQKSDIIEVEKNGDINTGTIYSDEETEINCIITLFLHNTFEKKKEWEELVLKNIVNFQDDLFNIKDDDLDLFYKSKSPRKKKKFLHWLFHINYSAIKDDCRYTIKSILIYGIKIKNNNKEALSKDLGITKPTLIKYLASVGLK